MKLHSDSTPGLNTVTAYGLDYIEINRQRFHSAVAFAPEGEVDAWEIRNVDDLTTDLLKRAVGLPEVAADPFAMLDEPGAATPQPDQAEVLLVGTGARQRFLAHSVLKPLLHAGVGVESMDTQAAARTYNILMAEGRRVVAILLPGDA